MKKLSEKITELKPKGKKPRDRPRKKWLGVMEECSVIKRMGGNYLRSGELEECSDGVKNSNSVIKLAKKKEKNYRVGIYLVKEYFKND